MSPGSYYNETSDQSNSQEKNGSRKPADASRNERRMAASKGGVGALQKEHHTYGLKTFPTTTVSRPLVQGVHG